MLSTFTAFVEYIPLGLDMVALYIIFIWVYDSNYQIPLIHSLILF